MQRRPRLLTTASLASSASVGVLALVVIAAILAGCTSAAPGSPGAASASPSPPAPDSSAVASGAASAPASDAAASTAAWPSGVPVLDPEYCPATLPADAHETSDGMGIDGDEAFIAHVEAALGLLRDGVPDAYATVLGDVAVIWQVESFSGMCYDTGIYRVGLETAFAPGYGQPQQALWLAGTIVHDGCHRARFVEGLAPSGRDAELACLLLQAEALSGMDGGAGFAAYVQNLAATVDDPASQYWTNPNRHW